MKKALIPGSFDPLTNGHYDIIKRAAEIFNEVYVVVFHNAEKTGKYLFSPEQRKEMIESVFENEQRIKVGLSSCLTVDYVKEKQIDVIVKGIRNGADYEYENGLYLMNRSLENVDTFFIPSKPENVFISSSFVRELLSYGRDVSKYVPEKVYEYLKK